MAEVETIGTDAGSSNGRGIMPPSGSTDQDLDSVEALFAPADFRLPHADADHLAKFESLAKTQPSLEALLSRVPPEPVLQNFATNVWEYAHGKTTLTSYPWNISIPVADLCNARCVFCTSWLHGRAILELDKLELFEPVLRHALYVGLVGHGEPLAHPRFDELCDRLMGMLDARANSYTITNGVFLDKWLDRLEKINLTSYTISLHAASAAVHDEMMGLGLDAFPRIIDSIGRLTALNRQNRNRNVYITFVVTKQNLHEISAFIELGNRLGVTEIYLRALAPQEHLTPGLNYHLLPAYLHPDFENLRERAIAAIRESQVPVQAEPHVWGQPVFPASLEEQLKLHPPQAVSRADALRDRQLRQSNQHVYHEQKGIFRGQPVDDSAVTSIRWSGGRLEVKTPKAAGSFAASTAVDYLGVGERRLRVEADVRVDQGAIGLGLHDDEQAAWDVWLCPHVTMPAGSAQTAVLETVTASQRIRLVIFNGGDGSAASVGTIGDVTIRSQDADQPSPFAWKTLLGHNTVDPLDDGTNPLGREPRFACKSVYYNFFLNEFYYRMIPCCYMSHVPGFSEVRFDGELPFMEAWNSRAMVELRDRLVSGPLFGACKRCPEKW